MMKIPKAKSELEETLLLHIRAEGLPMPEREHRFYPPRRWRFDFAWPELKIAVECEGLTHPGQKSRHTTNDGFTKDCEKYNRAALQGWTVLRYTRPMIMTGEAIRDITEALGAVGL